MSKRKAKVKRNRGHAQVRLTRLAKKHLEAICRHNGRDQAQQLSRIVSDAYARMGGPGNE